MRALHRIPSKVGAGSSGPTTNVVMQHLCGSHAMFLGKANPYSTSTRIPHKRSRASPGEIASSPNIQQIFNRIGTFKPEVFGIIQYGAFERNRVAMGLKETGPFFQSSMANNVLQGYVTRICERYKLWGSTDSTIQMKLKKCMRKYYVHESNYVSVCLCTH